MRRMSQQDREWLAGYYGAEEITAQEYYDLTTALEARELEITGGNGVTITKKALSDGRRVIEHNGMWETLYFLDTALTR